MLYQKNVSKKLHEWMLSVVDNHFRMADALKTGRVQIKELPLLYIVLIINVPSHIAAEELLKKGFVNISEYKGGMKEYNDKSSMTRI